MKSQIYYTSVIDRSSESIQRIKKQAQILLYGKVLSFGLFVLFVILWINDVTLTLSVSGTIVFLGSYLLFSIWDYRLSLKLSKLEKIIKVCTNEMNFKKGVFCGDDGKKFINPDHPFSYDIDVFGTNSLFHRINRTITDEGAIKLAKILSETGIGENIITERQRAIKELENNSDFRIDFSL
jgi:hypothetical protein